MVTPKVSPGLNQAALQSMIDHLAENNLTEVVQYAGYHRANPKIHS